MAGEPQDGMKTVECLRGRLLAERAASKAAQAEADQMAKRLAELEKQLEKEMRERAEKRLKFALKKLESLKVLDFTCQMDLSDSSASSSSPSRCFLNKEKFEKWRNLGQCGSPGRDLLRDYGSLNSFNDSAHRLVSQDGSCSSVGTASSCNKEASEGDGGSNWSGSQECADGPARKSSENTEILNCNENQTEKPIEERLALVPVNIPQEPAACSDSEVKNNVYDVLFALRQVREQLQNSIGRTGALYSTIELHGQRRTC
ncbi:uncharacterized protein LOC110026452 [Phalaenopsis equestris]|uniref:uncharacterized protein LOC110026452 n=1 Tax=Phalaenopsis equestris TaxID=78828 RepID=UPI0009E5B018|nr:uncharacterized protein LOC110026452 [Phalaenopsis equestris]XP_020583049.1 uncharacterized protein LOC110026452 [Phalaenopsis equestris]XP_020583050.1 uncharacterized protein LOC110026452 [Phalaenopsis equestris]